MIISGSEKIQVKCSGTATTTDPKTMVSYEDINLNGKVSRGDTDIVTNGATAVDAVGAGPEAGSRKITHMTLHNADSVAVTMSVLKYGGTQSLPELFKVTLQTLEKAVYTESTGWVVFDVYGNCKMKLDNAGTILAAQIPNLVVYQEQVAVTAFTDGGSTVGYVDLATTIPAGAVFLAAAVSGITGFAGDTSAAATLGDGSDVDRYNTSTMDLFSTVAAGVAAGVPSGTTFHATAKTPRLTVTTASDFTLSKTNAAGKVTVTLAYLRPV